MRLLILVLSFFIMMIFLYLNNIYPIKYIEIIKNTTFDKLLILSIIQVESNFRTNAISSVGAYGLMQVLPSTADWLNKKFNTHYDLKNPADNIKLGILYLEYLYNLTNDLNKAIAYYNTGPNATHEVKNTAGKSYLNKVKKTYSIYKFLYRSDLNEDSNR